MDTVINPPVKSPLSPEMPTAPTKEALAMNFKLDDSDLFDSGTKTTITTDKGVEIKESSPSNGQDKKEPNDISSIDAGQQRGSSDEPAKLVESGAKRSDQNDVGQAQQGERTTEAATAAEEDASKKKSVLKPPTKDKKETLSQESSSQDKPKIEPITPPKRDDAFDYSKYSPQEVVNLKNMSRQSREFAVKLMEENKQLAKQKDGLYLQHEQGYLLSPEFKELSSKRSMLAVEGNAWKDALIKIKKGEPFKEPVGYNPDGSLAFAAERTPTDDDELRISQIFSNTSNQYNNVSNQLSAIPKQYGDRVNADLIIIKDLQKQLFAWHQDPELMNHSVEVTGQGDRTLNQIKQEFISQWPNYMSSHPAVQIAADLMISLRIRDAELKEARSVAQVASIKQKEASRGEPSSGSLPSSTTSNTRKGVPSIFSLEDMPN